MADETPVVTEAAAAKEQVKAASAVPAPPPAVKAVPALKPEPEPDRMTVSMANAANGARYPGHEVTVDAETGRALVRTGEAIRVRDRPS